MYSQPYQLSQGCDPGLFVYSLENSKASWSSLVQLPALKLATGNVMGALEVLIRVPFVINASVHCLVIANLE